MKKQAEKSNLCHRVYDYVKDQVMSLQLKPGAKITEATLVEELQISRTPIREGLRLLAQDGVVVLHPNRFVEVSSFSEKDVHDIGALRISLDVLAAKLAVFHGSNSDFSKLQKLAQQCAEASKRGDIQARARLDCDFHLFLAEISKNKFLYGFQKELYTRVQMILITRYSSSNSVPSNGAGHSEIVDALFERDEAKVISCIRSHLVSFYEVDKSLPEDFFDRF